MAGIEVNTGLTDLIEKQVSASEKSARASRVVSAVLLARELGVDITSPLDAQKVMRHLESVEKYVNGSDAA